MSAAALRSPWSAFKAAHLRCSALRTGLHATFALPDPARDCSAAVEFRARCRSGAHTGHTVGAAPGFVQCNLVALPRGEALDFMLFALRNARACPILGVTEPGSPFPLIAPSADLRSDVPKYAVWRDGELDAYVHDARDVWRDDMVGFLLGCSFTWEDQLEAAGLTPRHVEQQCNVPMYRTSLPNVRVGPFGGDLVVSMRPYRPEQIEAVAGLTGRYPGAHGGPVHWGDDYAETLGIESLARPDFGDAVVIRDGEVPVFWACGVTPQTALMEAKLPLAITHAPGFMFVTDLIDGDLRCEA
jgi:uncharacterized protein YcsI (UPF0317 family)